MLTIACVLKSGGIYTAEWVARLRAQCRRWAPPHVFVCLSDVPVVCDRIKLRHDWPGWWAKLELFYLRGPILFFDLDTLIVGDLSDICGQLDELDLTALRDFYRPAGIGSGMMCWDFDLSRLPETFAADPVRWMAECPGGDQQFVERHVNLRAIVRWQDRLPGQIVSYKADRCETGAPPGARVVCLHGLPKFGDMPVDSWARRAWEDAA
jgi:hypothetical protein